MWDSVVIAELTKLLISLNWDKSYTYCLVKGINQLLINQDRCLWILPNFMDSKVPARGILRNIVYVAGNDIPSAFLSK